MASSLRHFAGIGFPAGNVAAASGCFLRYTPNFCTFVALRPTKLVAAAGKPGIHAEQPPQRQQLEDKEAAPCEGQHHEPAAPALRVGIVGFGNFRQFIAAGVQRQGHAVMATSRSDYSAYCAQHGIRFFRSVDELCEEPPDVLLICSSILSTESVVRAIPFHDIIVADVLSVKQFPRNLLLEVLPPSFGIVCTHPMFGPESLNWMILSQTLAGVQMALRVAMWNVMQASWMAVLVLSELPQYSLALSSTPRRGCEPFGKACFPGL